MKATKRFDRVGFQVDLARQMETPETLRKIIDFGGSVGYNELFLYGEGNLEYKSHPECSTPWALKQSDFIELRDYAIETYSMHLIPVIPVFGHANYILSPPEHAHLREIQNSSDSIIKCNMHQFCTSNPKSYVLIEDLLSEWMAITVAPLIHIGGDESWNFATCPLCREKAEKIGRGKLLAEYFNKVNSIMRKHDKQTMIWHDMLFYYEDCIQHLNKEIIICDWHYKTIERHPGISIYNWRKTQFLDTYEREGLSAYICPKSKCNYFEESENIKSFVEYAEPKKTAGFLNTVWEMSLMPFAAAYPSLAYGAAACLTTPPPVPHDFLAEFATKHFDSGREHLGTLVDLFENTAELRILAKPSSIINYQDPTSDLNKAAKLASALPLIENLEPKTDIGSAYKETLELIFRRNCIALRLKGLANEIARSYLPSRKIDQSNIENWLSEIENLLAKFPAQIALERRIWNEYRPREQANPAVEAFALAKDYFTEFLNEMRKVLKGELKSDECLPSFLELTLVNNDCSWQNLTISVSSKEGEYTTIGSYPQCDPFGRAVKTFPVPADTKSIKLELNGLGQLMIQYLRLIGPAMERVPKAITASSGAISNPDHILTDDFRPASMGDFNSLEYFSNGKEQPISSLDISLI